MFPILVNTILSNNYFHGLIKYTYGKCDFTCVICIISPVKVCLLELVLFLL